MKPVESGDKPLKQNPFITYRDPVTGLWIVDTKEQQKPNLGIA